MKANINNVDKTIRILLAILLVVLYIAGVVSGTLGIVFLIVAIVLLLTALINFCPVWHLLGINTRKKVPTPSSRDDGKKNNLEANDSPSC